MKLCFQFNEIQHSLQAQHKNQNGSSSDTASSSSPAKRFVFLNQDGTIRDNVDDRIGSEQNTDDTFRIEWSEDNYLDA